ncbi:hypothetical protein ACI01nite_05970 [Acetobacter cibinongensis]|uniref:Uncharacterized protein n=1 Tax=Acetobacter cibinongensis TaxID=146475 RepID=A0A0D6N454_9PROT|nr:hypothetical protein Abci_011_021 [Acetobacter cibinongensis]GBQ18948.1 hypothetical protein AA0482_2418 [Acetobacter cibinongensis NRIC 0482]GEL57995.1 hypothetical protein ACI01nite_05970 [Acetobacter cibinongensis]
MSEDTCTKKAWHTLDISKGTMLPVWSCRFERAYVWGKQPYIRAGLLTPHAPPPLISSTRNTQVYEKIAPLLRKT